jgi:hypothetical protein
MGLPSVLWLKGCGNQHCLLIADAGLALEALSIALEIDVVGVTQVLWSKSAVTTVTGPVNSVATEWIACVAFWHGQYPLRELLLLLGLVS